jgi:uncharacterized protein
MAEADLAVLLKEMTPEQVERRFVFVLLPENDKIDLELFATVREPEGLSAVVTQADADRLGLEYDFVAGWITLRVNSALETVGLTASVSKCLTAEGISCNVIAGMHHDHLLVPVQRVDDALSALRHLSASQRQGG